VRRARWAGNGRSVRGIAWYLAVLGLFCLLSLLLTYPLVRDLGSAVLGPPSPGDQFEYVYKVWWFKHALLDLHRSPFFNPEMFYPFGYNVALSETTLSNTIPALPLTVLLGEVAAYNLIVLASFILSGLGMYLLVVHLTGSRVAGVLSGTIFAFCPYRMAHLGAGHLPLMGTQWLPLLLLYLDRMVVRQQWTDAAMAGLFFSLAALSAWYYAYMFALAGAAYVLLRGRPWRQHLWQRGFAQRVLVFGAICLLLVGPVAVPVTQLWKEGNRPQSLRYLDQFSASPVDFVYPNVMQPLWGAQLLTHYPQKLEQMLFLGWVPLGLAAFALWHERGLTWRAFVWLSVIFVLLSLGTTLHWLNSPLYIAVPGWLERVFTLGMGLLTKRLALYPISSYSLRVENAVYVPLPTLLLYLFLPFFSAMRVWARFGLIAALGVSVLAGRGMERLLNNSAEHPVPAKDGVGWPPGARVSKAQLVTVLLCAAVILEFASFPYALGWSKVQARPVDGWLASQQGDFAVMEFPVSAALSGRSLYAMRIHGKSITFGYGTFFPWAFERQRATLESFPSGDSIVLLKKWDVRYVLVRSRSYGEAWQGIERDLMTVSGLRHVVTLDDEPIYEGDRLFHLMPGTEPAFVVDRIHVYEVL
jgi:hypothetical protein